MQRPHPSHTQRLLAFRWLPLLLAAIVLGTAVDAASAQGVRVRALGPTTLDGAGGEALTLTYALEQPATTGGTYAETVDAPAGWQVVQEEGRVEVPAGAQVSRLVTLLIPNDVTGGRYTITYTLRQTDGAYSSAPVAHTITIPDRHGIDVIPLDSAPYAIEGMPYAAEFIVQNNGNRPAQIVLDVLASSGWRATVDVPMIELAAGARQTVLVHMERVAPVEPGAPATAFIVAQLADDPKVAAGAQVSARVLARSPGVLAYHRYPAEVSVIGGVLQNPLYGAQAYARVQAQGEGTFREDGAAKLAFNVLSPAPQNAFSSLYGRDRYLIRFTHPNLHLAAGDLAPLTSPLMGFSAYGFGADARALSRYVGGGVYAVHDRLGISQNERQVGGHVYVQPLPFFQARGNVLHREGFLAGQALSLSGTVTPSDAVSVTAEYGRGQNATGQSGNAFSVQARGGLDLGRVGGALSLLYLNTAPTFPNRRRVHEEFRANGRLRFGRAWRATGYASFTRRNIGRTLDEAPNLDFFLSNATLSYRSLATLLYNGQRYRQTRLPSETTTDRHTLTLRSALPVGSVQLSGEATAGVLRQTSPTHQSQLILGAGVGASWAVPNRFTLAGRVNYIQGESVFSAREGTPHVVRGSVLVNGRVFSTVSMGLSVNANLRMSDVRTSTYFGGTGFVAYELPWKHTVEARAALRGFYNSFGGVSNWYEGGVVYRIPLGFRMHRSRKSGLVSGHVLDAQSGQGMSGIPVFIGDLATITDDDGSFALSALPVGAHDVRLGNPGQPGQQLVLANGSTVDVLGGQVTDVSLLAGSPASVSGLVTTQTGRPLPGVLVELAGPVGTVSALTDNQGRVRFSFLQPGSYTLRLQEHSLPPFHRAKRSELPLDLMPAEQLEATFDVEETQSLEQVDVLAASPERVHVVQRGETLAELARRYFGDWRHWRRIYERNRRLLPDPHRLNVGMELVIPNVEE